jgi:hypothetical protein
MHTTAWFFLMAVEALCRKSRRTLAIAAWIFWTQARAFLQLPL